MVYTAARPLIRTLLSCFFREVEIRGKVEEGPVILFGNHPNMLLDALLLYTSCDRDVWFLGKSTLFKNPIAAKFLRAAHVVPVYRRSDSNDTSKNRETFAAASATLNRGDAIALFPEGTSIGGRKILPFKTGIARIALQAFEDSEKKLPLRIQPIGITYSDPVTYRSSVTVQFGESIAIGDFIRSLPEGRSAVTALTDECESRIRKVTINVSPPFEELFGKISKLYGRVSEDTEYDKLRAIAHNIEIMAPSYPELVRQVEQKIDRVLQTDAPQYEPLSSQFYTFLPLIFVGAITFYYPYRLTGRFAKRISSTEVELGSNKLVLGTAIFTVWSLLLLLGLIILFGALLGILGWVSLVSCGVAIMIHLQSLENLIFFLLVPSRARRFRIARAELIEELEALRVDNYPG